MPVTISELILFYTKLFSILFSIIHKQFFARMDWFEASVVDLATVLVGNQVLLWIISGTVDIAHPVGRTPPFPVNVANSFLVSEYLHLRIPKIWRLINIIYEMILIGLLQVSSAPPLRNWYFFLEWYWKFLEFRKLLGKWGIEEAYFTRKIIRNCKGK